MSLVQMGDYPIAFFTEEVVGLAITNIQPNQSTLTIYLRNSQPIEFVSKREHVQSLFDATVSDLCGSGALVRKMDLSESNAKGRVRMEAKVTHEK